MEFCPSHLRNAFAKNVRLCYLEDLIITLEA